MRLWSGGGAMSREQGGAASDTELEKIRARYGLLAVLMSNLAIAGVAVFGVWRLNGDKAVIVGILTAAFTAVSGMTTAYLGIKAISNTARSLALGDGGRARQHSEAQQPAPSAPQAPSVAQAPSAPPASSAAPTPSAPSESQAPPAPPAPPAQRTP